jgi:FMN phosphatase YigB (HAD superfamily)
MRVGVDLDGVIYDFAMHVRRYLVDHEGHDAAALAHLESWDFWTVWGWDDERFARACDAAVDAGVLYATGEPNAGAVEALRRIADAGHTLHVVTARTAGTAASAAFVATQTWLDTYGVPYTSLTMSADKTVVPTDVFIDDSLPNYDALVAAGVRAYLLNQPWNAPFDDGRRRVADVPEFADLILGDAGEAPFDGS